MYIYFLYIISFAAFWLMYLKSVNFNLAHSRCHNQLAGISICRNLTVVVVEDNAITFRKSNNGFQMASSKNQYCWSSSIFLETIGAGILRN